MAADDGTGAVSVLVAAIGLVGTISAGLITVVATARAVAQARSRAAQDKANSYRDPLVHAAYNLQSRLWNIEAQAFLDIFWVGGTPRERAYAELNTVYLLGQYLFWAELIREEVQFLSSGRRRRQRRLIEQMELVRHVLADSRQMGDPTLRVFRGDQRALGELLRAPEESPQAASRMRCTGYAAFISRYEAGDELARWFAPVVADIRTLTSADPAVRERLCRLQVALVGLVQTIDPDGERVSAVGRSPLPVRRTDDG